MNHGPKPYSAYKDAGVPWVGSIPEHWVIQRGKALFSESCLPVRDSDEIVTCFRDGQVTLRRNRRSGGFMIALKEAGYQGVRTGQLVIHAMDAFAGAVGVSDSDGKCTPEYIVCNPRHAGHAPGYFAFALRVAAQIRFIEVECQAVRERAPRLRYPDFGSLQLPVPTTTEQNAIVRYLNHINECIRRHISAKKKLIALLNEQKQAIIHRAVTRGLDPNIRLRPSGVEWLGHVPEHWSVQRLKTLVTRVTSGSRGWSNFAADHGALFIRIGNLTRGSISLDMSNAVRLRLPPTVMAEAARTRVEPDDLLISITAFIGSIALVPKGIEEAYVSQHVACCRPRTGTANVRWIAYVLLSRVGQVHGQMCMYGGTKQGLSLDDVKNHVIVLPPRHEQDSLVDWIESESMNLDRGIMNTRREIDLLREYRIRLIADVVTGKLDVREAAARLPDEPDEPEPLDDDDASAEDDDEAALDEAPEEADA